MISNCYKIRTQNRFQLSIYHYSIIPSPISVNSISYDLGIALRENKIKNSSDFVMMCHESNSALFDCDKFEENMCYLPQLWLVDVAYLSAYIFFNRIHVKSCVEAIGRVRKKLLRSPVDKLISLMKKFFRSANNERVELDKCGVPSNCVMVLLRA